MKFYVRKDNVEEDYIEYTVGDYVLVAMSGSRDNLIDIIDFWYSTYDATEVYLDDSEVYVVYQS